MLSIQTKESRGRKKNKEWSWKLLNPEKTERQTDGAESYLSVFSYFLSYPPNNQAINNDFCQLRSQWRSITFFFFFDTLSLGLWIRKKEFPWLTQIGIMGPATSICSFLCCRGPGLVLCVWHIGPTNMGFEVSPAHEDSPKSRNLHIIWAWEAHIWNLFTY